MIERPDRVLAIDVDSAVVRGIVLVAGHRVVAGGYAQLGYVEPHNVGTLAARIAAALDVKAVLPVVVTCDDALPDGSSESIAAAITNCGFTSVTVASRDESARRANPGGGEPEELVDCEIALGLLTSHSGLTLLDLGPVVGAGLGVLGRGAGTAPAATIMAMPVNLAPHAAASRAPDLSAPAVPRRSRRGPLLALVAALLSAIALGVGVTQCGGDNAADPVPEQGQDEGESATPGDAAPTSVPATAVLPGAGEPTAEPALTPEPAPTATVAPTPEPTVEPSAALAPLSSLPARGAIFRPPTLYLQGPVQTQEQADAFYQRAIEVVGPDNVVNEYVVRSDAPPATDGNVRVEQAVLFQTASAVIDPAFIPTLDLGVLVMALNPQVTMIVEGHTDSVGDDESNQRLSQIRAQAVVEYLVRRGIDRARLQAVGLGESTPIAANDTDEGRQINRRIEVTLADLLADTAES